MEKRRSIFVLAASSLAMLIPSPGRFVYGLILIVELNYLIFLGTLALSLANKLKLNQLKSTFVFTIILSATILFKQILIIIQPEAALTLGFIIYFIPLSLFVIGYLYSFEEEKTSFRMKFALSHSLTYSVFALLFFLVRDILGYGTITYFGNNMEIVEKLIFSADSTSITSALASIPGALILSSIIIATHTFLRNKFNILKTTEENK